MLGSGPRGFCPPLLAVVAYLLTRLDAGRAFARFFCLVLFFWWPCLRYGSG